MKRKITLIIVSLCMSGLASAATLITDLSTNKLLGADDVLVNGQLYNVRFKEGSCIELFDGCNSLSDFIFSDLPFDDAPAAALLTQVIDADPLYDLNPELTFGCESTAICAIFTPWGFTDGGGTVRSSSVGNSDDGLQSDGFGLSTGTDRDDDTTGISNYVYADWTPVPIPATAWLFGTGLILLGARKLKQ